MGDVVRGAARRPAQVRKAHPWTISAAARRLFLGTLAATCNVARATEASGVSMTSFYRLRARDARFAEQWAEALTRGYERLEEALLEHALGTVAPTRSGTAGAAGGDPGGASGAGKARRAGAGAGADAEGLEAFADAVPLADPAMAHKMLVRRDGVRSGRSSPSGMKPRLVPIADVEKALVKLTVRLARTLGAR